MAGGDGPERPSLRPQCDHFANCLLLGLVRDELAIVAAPEPEGNPKIPPTGLLIGLHLPDTLADAVALGLGECGQLGWSLISATDGRSRR